MPVEVGVGYVSIVPETRGFGRLLERQIAGESADAGQAAGRQSGEGFLSGIGGAVKGGVVAVAAGAGALFAAGFAEAVGQSKANAKLGAQLGLSQKESARLGTVAGSVYSKGYGESIDQVNDALKGLAQNGVAAVNAPKKDLVGLSKAALNLAETFDADVGDSAKAAGQLIKTGLAKDGKAAFDLITKGFQSGADKAGDFLDTLNEYGTQFRKAGLSGATAVGLINQALQAGARDGDLAADAIKEFSIRAIDGSATSAEGFKTLGLNADDMAAKFARGGSAANGVLDLTLDKLRGIKDPVEQSQAAVALFGTQAEDLGAALFAMDPSEAAAGLGKVGGAAGKMGKSLHANAGASIEVFKRQVLQGVADFATRYALPALIKFGSFLNTTILPVGRAVGSVLAAVLVPAVRGVGAAFSATVGFLREYGAWLLPIGVAVGGLAVTMGASAIATAAATGVFSIYRGVILAATAVTRGWAVAQGILNAVMSANPVGLVITAVLALGAALFVAYKKSETFRNIVQGAWQGIQTAAVWAWENAIKPVVDGLIAGWRWIADGAVSLWAKVQPVLGYIVTGLKILAVVAGVLVFGPMILGIKVLGAVFGWLWKAAIQPVLGFIVAGFKLWWSGVKLYFGLVKTAVTAVGQAAMWLWQKAIQPAFRGIVTLASWWWSGVKIYFNAIRTGISAVGKAGSWLYTSAIRPAFQGIVSVASWLWQKGLKPVFDTGKRGVRLFGDAFERAKDAIGRAWGKLQGIAKKPVNFIIEWVYTKGIKAVWDKVAKFVGLGKLPNAPKLLADGGRTRGGVPGKDSIPALMMADEFVVKRDSARRVGFGTLEYINEHGELPVQRFADGGIVSDVWGGLKSGVKKVGGFVGDAVDFLSEPGKMWAKATAFVRDKIAKIGQSKWAQMLGRIPGKMLSGLKTKIVDAATGLFGSGGGGNIGGSGVKRWSSVVLQALKLVGQPASLLPVVLRRMNQESGGNPRAINLWDINARNGVPSKGLMQTIDPTFNAYAGKLRGRGVWDPLANIYASMRYALARYGSLSRAYNRPGGYAQGGSPRPGEVAWVGENGPELLKFGGGQTIYSHGRSMRIAERESERIAEEIGAALVGGMVHGLPRVAAATARMAQAVPVAAGQAPAGGLRSGDTLLLKIGEREFEAVVDERVDAGLDEVRRRKRAGARGR